jgi:proliferating cell nuclear antigen
MTTQYLEHDEDGFVIKKTITFKRVIGLLKDFIETANINIQDGTLALTALDSSHVSFVDLKLGPSFFSEFSVIKNKTIGINLPYFSRILAATSKEDTLKCVIVHNTFEIHVHNDKHHKVYKMNLYNIEETGINIPENEDEDLIELSLESKYLFETVQDLNIYGDNTRINILEGKIKLESNGQPGSLEVELSKQTEKSKRFNGSFSNKLLLNFIKGYNLDKFIFIELKEDYPMKLTYSFLDECTIDYYVAPRVEDY